eukprot:1589000-Rhodomonas_salina.2
MRRNLSNWIHPEIRWTERKGDESAQPEPSLDKSVPIEVGQKREVLPHSSALKPIPDFDVTNIIRRKERWQAIMPDLPAITTVLLNGEMSFPVAAAEIPSVDRPNLPTVAFAEDVLDDLVAEYLVTGAFEFVMAGCELAVRAISGMGLVIKKTHPFWRLITNFIPINPFLALWRSRMTGLAANASCFNKGAIGWSRDVSKGYLCSSLGGCDRGLHGNDYDDHCKRMKSPGVRRWWTGCTPETCKGTCSKALLGVRWLDHLFRMSCGWFGTRHGSNLLAALMEPLAKHIRETYGVHVILWVDDLLFLLEGSEDPEHDVRYCGQEGKCKFCTESFRKARKLEAEIDALLADLGFLTNEKNEPPSQVGEFCGLHWDTIRSVFFLTKEKALSLTLKCEELLSDPEPTPRKAAKLRGKLFWYSPCVPGVAILMRSINDYIGNPEDWDKTKQLSEVNIDDLEFLASALPELAEVARPMHPPSPAELLQNFIDGKPSADWVW